MEMKNIARHLAAVAAVSSMVACTADYIGINRNPYGVTDDEMQRDGYAVKASLIGMANGVISPDLNTAQFTDVLMGGVTGGYLSSANSGWDNTIMNYNPTDDWTNVLMKSDKIIPVIYSNYRQLHQVTDDPVILAVGEIIKVAAMHRVTDTYGPIPYSRIGQNGEINVPYDSQEAVYRKMFEELDAAVDALLPNRTSNFTASADVIYGGNVEKWIRFANSLKLRLAMRVVYADRTLAQAMAESAVDEARGGVMVSNGDNAMFSSWGVDGNPIRKTIDYNPVTHADGTPCTTRASDSRPSADIICYMNGYQDPRREKYFTRSEWDQTSYPYVGLRRGIVVPDMNAVSHRYSGVTLGENDPAYWMNAAEVAFLKAEAAAVFNFNMGTDGKTAYEEGIRLSFEQYGADLGSYLTDATSVPQNYTDPAGSNTYAGTISTITVAWDEAASAEEKQERIITQKWIANWLLGNEAWCDFRRTGYPRLMPATEEGNKSADRILTTVGARRMEYPDDEASTNALNYQEAVSALLGGADAMSTRLWFDRKPDNPTYMNQH